MRRREWAAEKPDMMRFEKTWQLVTQFPPGPLAKYGDILLPQNSNSILSSLRLIWAFWTSVKPTKTILNTYLAIVSLKTILPYVVAPESSCRYLGMAVGEYLRMPGYITALADQASTTEWESQWPRIYGQRSANSCESWQWAKSQYENLGQHYELW